MAARISTLAATSSIGNATALGTGATTLDGTLDLNGLNFTANNISGNGTVTNNNAATGATATFSGSGSTSFGGTIQNGAGTVAVAKIGTGTATLTGANTYTGGTFINGGILNVGSTGALGSGNITFGGGSIQYTSGIVVDHGSKIKNSTSAISIDTSTADVSYAGVIDSSNTAGLAKIGVGNLTLSGANAFSGASTVNAGTLIIGNATALGTSSATVANGATIDLNGWTIANALTINGTGIGAAGVLINNSTSTAVVSTNVLAGSNVTIGGTGNITLGQSISATAVRTITKIGSGTLTLTGTTGAGTPANFDVRNVINANEGTLVLALSGGAWCADSVNIGVSAGTSAVVKLDPANLSGGAIWNSQVNATYNVINGTLDLNGATAGQNGYIQQLTGDVTGIITNSSTTPAALTIRARDTNTTRTFAGVIQDGAGQVGMNFQNGGAGTGRVNELTGINTYTGPTNVNYGTLRLSGSGSIFNSSEIALSAGTTLDVSLYTAGTYATGTGQIISGSGTILGALHSRPGHDDSRHFKHCRHVDYQRQLHS